MLLFTIRDLLWLMVVVAVACGWLVDHDALKRQGHKWMTAFNVLQWNVCFDGYEVERRRQTLV
jgi:hypothetical protein